MSYFQRVIDFIDSPEILDASVTNIPKSSDPTLTIVACLAEKVHSITTLGNMAAFFGVYQGPVGEEVLKGIFGVGHPYNHFIILGKGSRVSVRSMTNTVINSGVITINFNSFSNLGGVS